MVLYRLYYLRFLTLCFFYCLGVCAHAQSVAGLQQQNALLEQQKSSLTAQLEAQQQQWAQQKVELESQDVDAEQVENIHFAQRLLVTEAKQIQQDLKDAEFAMLRPQREIARLELQLTDLRLSAPEQSQPVDKQQLLQQQLEQALKCYALLKQRTKLFAELLQVQQAQAKFLDQQLADYQQLRLATQQRIHASILADFVESEQQKQRDWLLEVGDLLSDADLDPLMVRFKRHLLEEKIKNSEFKVDITRLHKNIRGAIVQSKRDLSELESLYRQIKVNLNRTNARVALIEDYLDLLEKNKLLSKSENKAKLNKEFQSLLQEYELPLSLLQELEQELAVLRAEVKQKIIKQTSLRVSLPSLEARVWLVLGQEILTLPEATLTYLIGMKDSTLKAVLAMSHLQRITLGLILVAWLLAWFFLRNYSISVIYLTREKRDTVSANIVYIVASLLRRNLLALIALLMLVSVFILSGIPFRYYAILAYLTMLWILFRFIIGMARISLMDRLSDSSGEDVRLYYRLKWTLILGGLITALMVTVYQLEFSVELQHVLTRVFMLFLLMVSLVLLRGRAVVPNLLQPYLSDKRPYLFVAIRWLNLIIPLSLLSTAAIGLLGYADLAWTMSYYQLIFVCILTAYIVIRGVAVDLMSVLSQIVISHTKNGWLWSEALLKPIDKIIRPLILMGALFVLYQYYSSQSAWLEGYDVLTLFRAELFSVAGAKINIIRILTVIALVALFFWAARWIREFVYRWLLRDIADRSIRANLASFMQYVIFIVGVIVILHVLDLDFTGFAVLLGGIAVALGFGLRDFINNIVSGLMILIERPVREGDLVSIGEFEGEVVRTGFRSMTIRSWDNMEIIVPNAEIFNKSFTNWTGHDSVVRTIVPIKIQRKDNLQKVQELILTTLKGIPAILAEPEPQVYLRHIDSDLVEFQVLYFINLKESSRVAIRSQVLFSIYNTFKQHKISAPIPQQALSILNKGEKSC